MTIIINSTVIFIIGELVSLLIFAIVRKSFADGAIFKRPDIQTFKGIIVPGEGSMRITRGRITFGEVLDS
jgi:hypothetical protein